MRVVLAIVFAGLIVVTALAIVSRPTPPKDGKIHLLRTSDSHPRRALELAAFNRLNPGLFLKLDLGESPLTGGVEKIIVQASSRVGADLFDVYGGEYLQTFVEAGVAMDITTLAREHGFSMDDKVWPAVRGNIAYDGKQYSYPANCGVDILIYNKTIFDEMGAPYPPQDMTWEEMFALAQKVTRPRTTEHDLYFGVGQADWQHFFESQAGQFFSDDLTHLQITRGALPVAFQMHKDVIYKYKVAPSTVDLVAMSGHGGFGSGEALGQFADGHFAMITIGKWALVDFRAAYRDQVERAGGDPEKLSHVMRLGSVHLPHMQGRPLVCRVGAKSTCVNALGPNRDKAIAFLTFLAGPEYSAIINEGVDALPGNPAYADYGLQPGTPALSELEMHRNTVESMQYGYVLKQSPFLLTEDVYTVIRDQISRIEADPNLPVMNALQAAENQLLTLMQRNLDRDPQLAERFKKLTGTTDAREAQRRP